MLYTVPFYYENKMNENEMKYLTCKYCDNDYAFAFFGQIDLLSLVTRLLIQREPEKLTTYRRCTKTFKQEISVISLKKINN